MSDFADKNKCILDVNTEISQGLSELVHVNGEYNLYQLNSRAPVTGLFFKYTFIYFKTE
jgi:hypothetical protein